MRCHTYTDQIYRRGGVAKSCGVLCAYCYKSAQSRAARSVQRLRVAFRCPVGTWRLCRPVLRKAAAAAVAFSSCARERTSREGSKAHPVADGWRGGTGCCRAAAPPEARVPRQVASRLRPRTRQVCATVSTYQSKSQRHLGPEFPQLRGTLSRAVFSSKKSPQKHHISITSKH